MDEKTDQTAPTEIFRKSVINEDFLAENPDRWVAYTCDKILATFSSKDIHNFDQAVEKFNTLLPNIDPKSYTVMETGNNQKFIEALRKLDHTSLG